MIHEKMKIYGRINEMEIRETSLTRVASIRASGFRAKGRENQQLRKSGQAVCFPSSPVHFPNIAFLGRLRLV
jgi:hypothetical protein